MLDDRSIDPNYEEQILADYRRENWGKADSDVAIEEQVSVEEPNPDAALDTPAEDRVIEDRMGKALELERSRELLEE